MAFKYKKGLLAKDKITGYTGIINSRTEYITGCDGYGLVPQASADNKLDDGRIFDENRIKIIGKGVSDDPEFASDGLGWEDIQAAEEPAKKETVKPGGPQDAMIRTR